jgi:hypothetical protein
MSLPGAKRLLSLPQNRRQPRRKLAPDKSWGYDLVQEAAMKWLTLALVLLTCGCAGPAWRRFAVVRDEGGVLVELERHTGIGTFDHPASVDIPDLRSFLERLTYDDLFIMGSLPNDIAVFRPERSRALTAAVCAALERAGSTDRIRFCVTYVDRYGGRAPSQRRTGGVIFIEPEGVMNIVFDFVGRHYPVRRQLDEFANLRLPAEASYGRDAAGRDVANWVTIPLAKLGTQHSP